MHRAFAIGFISFATGISLLFLFNLNTAHASLAPTVADQSCPTANNDTTVYKAGKPRKYTEQVNGQTKQITNYYGQSCIDPRGVSGICVTDTKCRAENYKDLTGQQKDVNSTAATVGGSSGVNTSGTPPAANSTTADSPIPNSVGSAQPTQTTGSTGNTQSAFDSSLLNSTPYASQPAQLTPVDSQAALNDAFKTADQPVAEQPNTLQAATTPTGVTAQPVQTQTIPSNGQVSQLAPSTNSFAPNQTDATGNTVSPQQLANDASTFRPASESAVQTAPSVWDRMMSGASTVGSYISGAATAVGNYASSLFSTPAADTAAQAGTPEAQTVAQGPVPGTVDQAPTTAAQDGQQIALDTKAEVDSAKQEVVDAAATLADQKANVIDPALKDAQSTAAALKDYIAANPTDNSSAQFKALQTAALNSAADYTVKASAYNNSVQDFKDLQSAYQANYGDNQTALLNKLGSAIDANNTAITTAQTNLADLQQQQDQLRTSGAIDEFGRTAVDPLINKANNDIAQLQATNQTYGNAATCVSSGTCSPEIVDKLLQNPTDPAGKLAQVGIFSDINTATAAQARDTSSVMPYQAFGETAMPYTPAEVQSMQDANQAAKDQAINTALDSAQRWAEGNLSPTQQTAVDKVNGNSSTPISDAIDSALHAPCNALCPYMDPIGQAIINLPAGINDMGERAFGNPDVNALISQSALPDNVNLGNRILDVAGTIANVAPFAGTVARDFGAIMSEGMGYAANTVAQDVFNTAYNAARVDAGLADITTAGFAGKMDAGLNSGATVIDLTETAPGVWKDMYTPEASAGTTGTGLVPFAQTAVGSTDIARVADTGAGVVESTTATAGTTAAASTVEATVAAEAKAVTAAEATAIETANNNAITASLTPPASVPAETVAQVRAGLEAAGNQALSDAGLAVRQSDGAIVRTSNGDVVALPDNAATGVGANQYNILTNPVAGEGPIAVAETGAGTLGDVLPKSGPDTGAAPTPVASNPSPFNPSSGGGAAMDIPRAAPQTTPFAESRGAETLVAEKSPFSNPFEQFAQAPSDSNLPVAQMSPYNPAGTTLSKAQAQAIDTYNASLAAQSKPFAAGATAAEIAGNAKVQSQYVSNAAAALTAAGISVTATGALANSNGDVVAALTPVDVPGQDPYVIVASIAPDAPTGLATNSVPPSDTAPAPSLSTNSGAVPSTPAPSSPTPASTGPVSRFARVVALAASVFLNPAQAVTAATTIVGSTIADVFISSAEARNGVSGNNFGNLMNPRTHTPFSYATPAVGAQADLTNMIRWIQRGDNTIYKLMMRLSPPYENNTAQMIAHISNASGVGPNTILDPTNEALMIRIFDDKTFLEHSTRASSVLPAKDITQAYHNALASRGLAPTEAPTTEVATNPQQLAVTVPAPAPVPIEIIAGFGDLTAQVQPVPTTVPPVTTNTAQAPVQTPEIPVATIPKTTVPVVEQPAPISSSAPVNPPTRSVALTPAPAPAPAPVIQVVPAAPTTPVTKPTTPTTPETLPANPSGIVERGADLTPLTYTFPDPISWKIDFVGPMGVRNYLPKEILIKFDAVYLDTPSITFTKAELDSIRWSEMSGAREGILSILKNAGYVPPPMPANPRQQGMEDLVAGVRTAPISPAAPTILQAPAKIAEQIAVQQAPVVTPDIPVSTIVKPAPVVVNAPVTIPTNLTSPELDALNAQLATAKKDLDTATKKATAVQSNVTAVGAAQSRINASAQLANTNQSNIPVALNNTSNAISQGSSLISAAKNIASETGDKTLLANANALATERSTVAGRVAGAISTYAKTQSIISLASYSDLQSSVPKLLADATALSTEAKATGQKALAPLTKEKQTATTNVSTLQQQVTKVKTQLITQAQVQAQLDAQSLAQKTSRAQTPVVAQPAPAVVEQTTPIDAMPETGTTITPATVEENTPVVPDMGNPVTQWFLNTFANVYDYVSSFKLPTPAEIPANSNLPVAIKNEYPTASDIISGTALVPSGNAVPSDTAPVVNTVTNLPALIANGQQSTALTVSIALQTPLIVSAGALTSQQIVQTIIDGEYTVVENPAQLTYTAPLQLTYTPTVAKNLPAVIGGQNLAIQTPAVQGSFDTGSGVVSTQHLVLEPSTPGAVTGYVYYGEVLPPVTGVGPHVTPLGAASPVIEGDFVLYAPPVTPLAPSGTVPPVPPFIYPGSSVPSSPAAPTIIPTDAGSGIVPPVVPPPTTPVSPVPPNGPTPNGGGVTPTTVVPGSSSATSTGPVPTTPDKKYTIVITPRPSTPAKTTVIKTQPVGPGTGGGGGGSSVASQATKTMNDLLSALAGFLKGLFGGGAPTSPTQPTTPSTTATSTTATSTTPQLPIATVLANPTSVPTGLKSFLMWASVNTVRCGLTSPDGTVLATSMNGSTSTLPLATTTLFTLNCTGVTGATTTATTTVKVTN